MSANHSEREPEVLPAVRPAIRRGRHAALCAGAGSGHELVFAEAVSSACKPGDGLQALVLAPTREDALRIAAILSEAPLPSGLRLRVWPVAGSVTGTGGADVLVGRPIPLLREIRGGRVSTAGIRLICVDEADLCLRLGEWPAVEALLDTVGSETQRVVASASFEGELGGLLERQLARARRWPEELFDEEGAQADAERRHETLWYGAAVREEERLDLLAAVLAEGAPAEQAEGEEAERRGGEAPAAPSLVHCPDAEVAGRVRMGLEARGIRAEGEGALEGASVSVRVEGADDTTAAAEAPLALAARWGAPDDLAGYVSGLPAAVRKVAIIDARHLAQLKLLGRRAGWEVRPLEASWAPDDEEAERFRGRVRARLEAGEVSGELLLLRPLLEERPAAVVAGALASLLRERLRDAEAEEAATAGRRGGPAREARREAVLPAWTRLFVGVGKRDGAGPGDIVGAITGETGAAGGQIGRIDVRSGFTLVDIDAEIADRVIRLLRGTQIKGRTVNVRRDREASPPGG
jgi:ATP-dependent RNA helicase DeaD